MKRVKYSTAIMRRSILILQVILSYLLGQQHCIGLDYQYVTKLAKKGKDFYVTFTGSPSLTKDNLDLLVAELKNHNIKHIDGNIILDDSMFKAPFYPGGITYDDLGLDYTAPSSAIIINKNIELFAFNNEAIGQTPKIIPENPHAAVKIINDLKIVDEAVGRYKPKDMQSL